MRIMFNEHGDQTTNMFDVDGKEIFENHDVKKITSRGVIWNRRNEVFTVTIDERGVHPCGEYDRHGGTYEKGEYYKIVGRNDS